MGVHYHTSSNGIIKFRLRLYFSKLLKFWLSLVLFAALVYPWLCLVALCTLVDVDFIDRVFIIWFDSNMDMSSMILKF